MIWLCVVALIACAWVPLLLLPVNHDLAWALHVAGRASAGERLYADFIEINPPLIFWLARLADAAAGAVDVPSHFAYQSFATGLVLGGLLLAAHLLTVLLQGERAALRACALLLLAFVLGPLSGYEFGQREHLMLAGLVPYLLGTAAFVQGRALRPGLMFAAGLLTSFGLAMKPFFLPVWLTTEAYAWHARRRAALGRPQALGILCGFLLYGVALLVLADDYFGIARWGFRAYGEFYPTTLSTLVLSDGTVLALLAVGLLLFLPWPEELRTLRLMGAATLVALLFAVYLQRKGWDYHWYPIIGTALFLGAVAIGGIVSICRQSMPLPPELLRRGLVGFGLVLILYGLTVANRTLDRMDGLRGNPYFLPELASALAPYGGSSILPISTNMQSTLPLVHHAGMRHASRFPTLWPLPYAYRDVRPSAATFRYHARQEMGEVEAYLFDSVLEDFTKRPDFVLVDMAPPANNLFGFDWMVYLGQDPRFLALLSEYEEVALVGGRYRIFARVEGRTSDGR